MPEDLNSLHLPTGDEREIFEPENAWSGASGRVIVRTNKMAGGVVCQMGYDPESNKHWMRLGNTGAWGDWTEMVAPEPVADDAASDEYETTDMQARRGPGRPRKSAE